MTSMLSVTPPSRLCTLAKEPVSPSQSKVKRHVRLSCKPSALPASPPSQEDRSKSRTHTTFRLTRTVAGAPPAEATELSLQLQGAAANPTNTTPNSKLKSTRISAHQNRTHATLVLTAMAHAYVKTHVTSSFIISQSTTSMPSP